MADVRAALRVTDELLWVLRRTGFAIATSQAIDPVRAVRAVGLESRETVRDAIAAVVVKRARDRARFDEAFDAYFSRTPRRTLWERLADDGFDDAELDALRELLDAFAAAFPTARWGRSCIAGPSSIACCSWRAARRCSMACRARCRRGSTRIACSSTWGRGAFKTSSRAFGSGSSMRWAPSARMRLVAALRREVQRAARTFAASSARRSRDVMPMLREARTSWARRSLRSTTSRSQEVRRAVRAFVQRLRGGERVRRRRSRKGRVDAPCHAPARDAHRRRAVHAGAPREAPRQASPRSAL